MAGAADGQVVSRWMGASICRMPGSVVDQLLAMREGICRLNARTGVRTALLYSSGWFLQWHEGSAAAVEDVWRRSLTHPGHAHPRLIHRSEGVRGLLESLHIATLHNHDKPSDVARRLYGVEREHELGWNAEPAEIWHALSAPCMLPADAGAVARRHVVAVTSEFTESVDLIKRVADHCGGPICYQRFAGGDVRAGDAGAAYVDIAGTGHVTRLQGLSRRALENSMIKLSLGQLQCLMLLTGSRPHHARRLATAVAGLLGDAAVRPSVRIIGACERTRAEAADAMSAVPALEIAQIDPGRSERTLTDAVMEVVADEGETIRAGLEFLRAAN